MSSLRRLNPMFDSLSEKLQATLADVRGRGTLTEDDISAAMREIRLALLEADVNFKVVKTFTGAVRERALGADIIGQLNPGQQVVKIVSDELTELMGGSGRELAFSPRPPTVVLMAGLQGSGKTTATGKLARYLREQHGSSVAVAACDVYRPAAVEQLIKVGAQAGAAVYEQGTDRNPVEIAKLGARTRQVRGQGCPDRRHQRPAARRHRADGRAGRDQARGQPPRHPARRRRDDRSGRGQRRRAVRRGGRLRRRGDVKARRRCPRRCRAVGQGDHRQADHVRLHRREARPVRALPPRPDVPADPRHGRRDDPDREGRVQLRRKTRRPSSSASCASPSSASTTSWTRCDRSASSARCSRCWG